MSLTPLCQDSREAGFFGRSVQWPHLDLDCYTVTGENDSESLETVFKLCVEHMKFYYTMERRALDTSLPSSKIRACAEVAQVYVSEMEAFRADRYAQIWSDVERVCSASAMQVHAAQIFQRQLERVSEQRRKLTLFDLWAAVRQLQEHPQHTTTEYLGTVNASAGAESYSQDNQGDRFYSSSSDGSGGSCCSAADPAQSARASELLRAFYEPVSHQILDLKVGTMDIATTAASIPDTITAISAPPPYGCIWQRFCQAAELLHGAQHLQFHLCFSDFECLWARLLACWALETPTISPAPAAPTATNRALRLDVASSWPGVVLQFPLTFGLASPTRLHTLRMALVQEDSGALLELMVREAALGWEEFDRRCEARIRYASRHREEDVREKEEEEEKMHAQRCSLAAFSTPDTLPSETGNVSSPDEENGENTAAGEQRPFDLAVALTGKGPREREQSKKKQVEMGPREREALSYDAPADSNESPLMHPPSVYFSDARAMVIRDMGRAQDMGHTLAMKASGTELTPHTDQNNFYNYSKVQSCEGAGADADQQSSVAVRYIGSGSNVNPSSSGEGGTSAATAAAAVESHRLLLAEQAALLEHEIAARRRSMREEQCCFICYDDSLRPTIATLCCGQPTHVACLLRWYRTRAGAGADADGAATAIVGAEVCPGCRQYNPEPEGLHRRPRLRAQRRTPVSDPSAADAAVADMLGLSGEEEEANVAAEELNTRLVLVERHQLPLPFPFALRPPHSSNSNNNNNSNSNSSFSFWSPGSGDQVPSMQPRPPSFVTAPSHPGGNGIHHAGWPHPQLRPYLLPQWVHHPIDPAPGSGPGPGLGPSLHREAPISPRPAYLPYRPFQPFPSHEDTAGFTNRRVPACPYRQSPPFAGPALPPGGSPRSPESFTWTGKALGGPVTGRVQPQAFMSTSRPNSSAAPGSHISSTRTPMDAISQDAPQTSPSAHHGSGPSGRMTMSAHHAAQVMPEQTSTNQFRHLLNARGFTQAADTGPSRRESNRRGHSRNIRDRREFSRVPVDLLVAATAAGVFDPADQSSSPTEASLSAAVDTHLPQLIPISDRSVPQTLVGSRQGGQGGPNQLQEHQHQHQQGGRGSPDEVEGGQSGEGGPNQLQEHQHQQGGRGSPDEVEGGQSGQGGPNQHQHQQQCIYCSQLRASRCANLCCRTCCESLLVRRRHLQGRCSEEASRALGQFERCGCIWHEKGGNDARSRRRGRRGVGAAAANAT